MQSTVSLAFDPFFREVVFDIWFDDWESEASSGPGFRTFTLSCTYGPVSQTFNYLDPVDGRVQVNGTWYAVHDIDSPYQLFETYSPCPTGQACTNWLLARKAVAPPIPTGGTDMRVHHTRV